MTKPYLHLPLCVATIALLAGCGGGSDNPPAASTADTGTGYYLDSAVEGIEYTCGSQSGKTDKEGKFIFEKGKECRFTLADIPVKTIDADRLHDGVKIVEDDVKVARFLQSIDSDGDPSNGITINDQVLEALTKALETVTVTDKAQVITDETTMTEVVAVVGNEVKGVSGELRSDADVEAHLTQTQTEVTKELLSGKTFYGAYTDEGRGVIEKLTFNNDVTSVTWQEIKGGNDSGTATLTINGNMLISRDKDGETPHKIVEVTDKYIKLEKPKGNGSTETSKLYFNKADAEAYLQSLTDGSSSTPNNNSLSDIAGKTVYQYCTDNSELFQMTFQDNGQIEVKEYNETFYVPYRIDGNTIYTTENGTEKAHILLEFTDTYVKFDDDDNETSTFYFTEADASANADSDCGHDDDGYSGGYGLDDTINSHQWQSTALRSPNGGESWQNGESRSIQWDTTKIQGTTVNCYVLHDNPADILAALENNDAEALKNAVVGSAWFKFVNDVSNSGNVQIDPQIMQGTGNAYLVLIVSNNGYWDISDSLFSLNQ